MLGSFIHGHSHCSSNAAARTTMAPPPASAVVTMAVTVKAMSCDSTLVLIYNWARIAALNFQEFYRNAVKFPVSLLEFEAETGGNEAY